MFVVTTCVAVVVVVVVVVMVVVVVAGAVASRCSKLLIGILVESSGRVGSVCNHRSFRSSWLSCAQYSFNSLVWNVMLPLLACVAAALACWFLECVHVPLVGCCCSLRCSKGVLVNSVVVFVS